MPSEADIKAAALKTPSRSKLKLEARTLADPLGTFKKVLLQGNTGTGKTRTLAEVLQTVNRDGRPTRVFVASTDIGGSGLSTVEDRLRAVGRPELLSNIVNVDFDD